MNNDLDALAKLYGTDKSSLGHGYTHQYQLLTQNIRSSVKLVVEIGVQKGASIRMWCDWFPNAKIFGIDNLTEQVNMSVDGFNMQIIVGDQTDPQVWNRIPNEIDVVIDDGSHRPEDMIGSFSANFHKLRSGGLWIIEDIHCLFHERFNPSMSMQFFSWIGELVRKQQMNGRASGKFYDACIDEQDALTRQIYGIRAYKSIIVFERA